MKINQKEFDSKGFVLKKNWIQYPEVRELINVVESLSAEVEDSDSLLLFREDPSDATSNIRVIENICSSSEALYGLSARISGAIENLFGKPMVLFKDKIVFKYPGGRGYRAHQDGLFYWIDQTGKERFGWYDYAGLFVNVAIFLEASGAHNGGIEISPVGETGRIDAGKFHGLYADNLDSLGYLTIEAEPGDALVFGANVPHRSFQNLSDCSRRILYFTYNFLEEGDHRIRYYEDKKRSLSLIPHDCIPRVLDKEFRGGLDYG